MILFQVILLWNVFHATFPSATIIGGANLPHSCNDITFVTSSNGIYRIYPTGDLKGIDVQCDMKTDGGGWTVITNRKNWKMDFNRSWTEYRDGFGCPDDSYWIGNKYIHTLTAGRNTQVYFALDFTNGSSRYAKYKNFTIGSEEEKFKITYNGESYTGDAGMGYLPVPEKPNLQKKLSTSLFCNRRKLDELCHKGNINIRRDAIQIFFELSLSIDFYQGNALYGSADSRYYPARMFFTTYDHDNDRNPYSNCASDWGGGWWYNNCHQTCLTGTPGTAGYQWHGIGSGRIYRLAASRIMIR